MPSYDRFWDIYLTARDGKTQNAYDMRRAPAYAQRLGLGAVDCFTTQSLVAPAADYCFTPGVGLARPALGETGYVISAVSTVSLETAAVDTWSAAIAGWVSDPRYSGKVRFNSHGTPGGNLASGFGYTPPDEAVERRDSVAPETLARWLRANGLGGTRSAGGVDVLCLALCHAASPYLGDPNRSILMRVTKQCQAEELFGLRLTGAATTVSVGPRGMHGMMPSGVSARLAHTDEKYYAFVFPGVSKLPLVRGLASAVHATTAGTVTGLVAVGTRVKHGSRLLSVGAEPVLAPRDGTVETVNAANGGQVIAGQTLVVLREPIKPFIAPLLGWSTKQHHETD